ncbi:hypothetical protein F0562_021093 [Nyssa sinensis]|uniref:Uncharacterized protein n=1 Tax=Nyssa sinensis TaxID=561372 RepID=A0A5J5BNY0_9ASTE|nr:hypothetical protein F0562_021093 [Nyssa sinensis]
MVWSHPDISLEDLLNLIKGFVDILILASGYQTSGHLAHWDAQNIKNVFQWGLFFEDVFKRLSCLEDYQDSAKELDAALSEMTSNPCFPQVDAGRVLHIYHLSLLVEQVTLYWNI